MLLLLLSSLPLFPTTILLLDCCCRFPHPAPPPPLPSLVFVPEDGCGPFSCGPRACLCSTHRGSVSIHPSPTHWCLWCRLPLTRHSRVDLFVFFSVSLTRFFVRASALRLCSPAARAAPASPLPLSRPFEGLTCHSGGVVELSPLPLLTLPTARCPPPHSECAQTEARAS